MAKIGTSKPLLPSVFDRLLDDEPENSREAPKSRNQVLRELKQSVRRDLENLLNTRQHWGELPPELAELKHSLANYGIPDFSGVNMSSSDERRQLCDAVQRVVEHFEPRFKSVRVHLLTNSDEFDRTLRLRIDGVLYAEPAPEPVVFDSQFEPHSMSVKVKTQSH